MKTIKVDITENEFYNHEKAKKFFTTNTVFIGIENEFSIKRTKYQFCRKNGLIKKIPASCRPLEIYSCEDCPDYILRDLDLNTIQSALLRDLVPTKNHYSYGDNGVFWVGTDGSVPNGIEITTVGLPLIPEIIYATAQNMFNKIAFLDPELNQYCGLHTHIVQHGNETAMSFFPYGPYTLHNIMALNTYALPLLALMGVIDGRTRYNVFRLPYQYINVLKNQDLLNAVDRQPHSGKYIATTPYLSISNNGKLKHIHLECRYPDNHLDPTYYLIHSVFPSVLSIAAVQLEANKIFDINNEEYKASMKLIVKIINDGAGDRNGLYLIKDKDIKEILKIRDSLSEIIAPILKEIDPNGNLIEIWEDFPQMTPYKSTRPTYNLLKSIQ